MVYGCTMAGVVSGQYGLGFSAVAWTISLLVIGLLVVGLYKLSKSIEKKR